MTQPGRHHWPVAPPRLDTGAPATDRWSTTWWRPPSTCRRDLAGPGLAPGSSSATGSSGPTCGCGWAGLDRDERSS